MLYLRYTAADHKHILLSNINLTAVNTYGLGVQILPALSVRVQVWAWCLASYFSTHLWQGLHFNKLCLSVASKTVFHKSAFISTSNEQLKFCFTLQHNTQRNSNTLKLAEIPITYPGEEWGIKSLQSVFSPPDVAKLRFQLCYRSIIVTVKSLQVYKSWKSCDYFLGFLCRGLCHLNLYRDCFLEYKIRKHFKWSSKHNSCWRGRSHEMTH